MHNRQIILFLSGLFLIILFASCSKTTELTASEGYLEGYDGSSLYYNLIGSGQDTIVVVHGGPGAGMNSVKKPFEPLAKNFVLLFYDQRGGGRSTLPSDTTKLKPKYYVEDLEAVRNHFDLGKMNVLTHSFGSILVAQYAMKYHDNLNRIVFHGATGPDLIQELKIREKKSEVATPSVDTVLANRARGLLRSLLDGTAANPVESCNEYEQINRKLAFLRGDSVKWDGTSCEASPEAVKYYYRYTAQLAPRYFGPWDFTKQLEKVNAPILVVWGKQDSLMIPAQKAWVDAVPNGQLLLVPDAKKGSVAYNPNFVLPAITKFFNESKKQNSF